MLRSFDYAPARRRARPASEHDAVGDEQRQYRATEWSERNRDAFLEAYAGDAAARSTRRPCSPPTWPTRPSTRPSTRPATGRPGCPSRWPPSPDSTMLRGSRNRDHHREAGRPPRARAARPRRARPPAHRPRPAPPRRRRHRPRAQAAGVLRRGRRTATPGTGSSTSTRASGPASSPTPRTCPDYRIEVSYDAGPITLDDPYRFLPTLGEIDLHLINEGRHENLWEVLGARVHRYDTPFGDASPAPRSPSGRRPPAACG